MRVDLQKYWPTTHEGNAYPGTLSQSMEIVREGMRLATSDEKGTALWKPISMMHQG